MFGCQQSALITKDNAAIERKYTFVWHLAQFLPGADKWVILLGPTIKMESPNKLSSEQGQHFSWQWVQRAVLELLFLALVDVQEFRANTISGRKRQYRNGRCVSLYVIIFFKLPYKMDNEYLLSFCGCVLDFVYLLLWHKTSLRVSIRRPSFMPKYRYLVVPLAVQVWWAATGQRPNTHPPTHSLSPAGWRESRGKKVSQIEIMMV